MLRTNSNKNLLLNLIGILLILFFIIRLIFLIKDGEIISIFWLCNHAMLIMGIAILIRSSFWLAAEISFAFVGVLVWITDYFSKILFNIHLFGSTDYLFPIVNKGFFLTTSMVHLFSLPLGILAFFLISTKQKHAWKGAILHVILLIPPAIYFGEYYNLNCLLKPCISWLSCCTFYPILFPIAYIIVFIIPTNYFLNKLLSKTNQ